MCTSEDIVDSLHGEALLCSLNEQRMQGFLCDVTIVVEDTKFKAHRNILAASSLYFRNHFRSQSILIQGHVLELNDLKADTFTEILNFIYSSKIAVKKKETLTDLVDAGKKLGITFLENIKASKKPTVVACSTEREGNAPPAFYRGENSLKSETVEKRGIDPAIANGPRITNAFSILETEVNGFSPLDLRANFKKSTGPTEEVHSGGNCENGVCSDGEPVNTLAEHSYAVSSGDASYKRDSVFDHGNKGSHTKDQECTPGGATTNQVAKTSNSMPGIEPQFNPQAVIQTCTSNSVSSSTEQTANQTEFYSQREDESTLPQLPPGNPPVTQSFCNAGLYPRPKKHHVTFNCKNCSKEFAHFKRLQRHEQICFKVVHMDRDLRLPNTLSQGASAENYCTPTETATHQNALTNGSSSATDHFVKIVDDKIFYVCIVCKRNYLTLSSLRRHSNVHSWRKSYPCHYCSKVFALAEYRTKHEIWHTGDRRYQCIFCLETFMTYYILKNHQKSSHGIDPRLGVGSKANRGLKPSIYPYKLYRLLPMKCKRPPLKTPRTASAAHFQVQNSFTAPTVVQNTLNAQPCSVNSQDAFSSTLDAPSQNVTSSTTSQDTWPFDIIQSDKNTSVLPVGKANSSSHVSASTLKQSGSAPGPQFNENQNLPSVINASNSAPSVIMHSSRVSSVIMHGNAITSSGSTNGIGWNPSRTIASPEKDTSQETNPETTEANTELESPTGYKNGDAHKDEREFSLPAPSSKNNKSVIREGNKTETYIAKPALPGTLVNSGIAPFCQITVKIGSEALVKRQISGSSLFFRKSGRPKHSEPETAWLDSDDDKRERCSIRLRRSDSVQMEEMCDDASDQDVSDKPWRPYYNYKPKKKSKHFKKFRKLKKRKKHSRSRPTEENVSEVDTKCSSEEAIDENTNGGDDSPETLDFECPPEKTIEQQEKAGEQEEAVEQEMAATQWQLDTKACFCELCQKSFRNPSTLKVHMRCHTGEKPYSCKVCGKCFSFPGNLSKHERIHQVGKNLTCQYCKKTFLLHKTLKKHERIHTGDKMYDCKFCSQQFLYLTSRDNHEQKHLEEQSEKGFFCVQCSKVCKTAAALVMHQKKHYFRGLKHMEHKDPQTSAAEICTWGGAASSICNDPKMTGERGSGSMPESFPPSFDDCETPLLSYSTGVTEVIPQNVCTASPVENVSAIGETDSSHFMTPPPLPPVALHSSVLMEVPKGWKHWKTRHYNLEENLNSETSSLKESTKTFTELKTMTSFDNPFVP